MKYLGEPLNGFAPNSHGRHVWFVSQMNLEVKVKGQGYRGQKGIFWPFSSLRAVYCGKTSLACSSF